MTPKPHQSRYFALVMYILALIGATLGAYHIGYKDGYISAMRQFIFSITPAQPSEPPTNRV